MTSNGESSLITAVMTESHPIIPLVNVPVCSEFESVVTKNSIKDKKGKSYKGLQKHMKHLQAMKREMKLKDKLESEAELRRKRNQNPPQPACLLNEEDQATPKHEPETKQGTPFASPITCSEEPDHGLPTYLPNHPLQLDTRSSSDESTRSIENDSPIADYGTATIISSRRYSSTLPSSSYSTTSGDGPGVPPHPTTKMSLIERARCISTDLRRHNEALAADRARLDEHRRCSQQIAPPSTRSPSPTGTVVHHEPPSSSLSSSPSASDGSDGQVPPEPIRILEEVGKVLGAKKGQKIREKAKRATRKVLWFLRFTKKQ